LQRQVIERTRAWENEKRKREAVTDQLRRETEREREREAEREMEREREREKNKTHTNTHTNTNTTTNTTTTTTTNIILLPITVLKKSKRGWLVAFVGFEGVRPQVSLHRR